VQDRCAARLFGSWLLLVRGRVRRAGAGPMAVTVNATECWDIPALEEIRLAGGLAAVRAALATGRDLQAGPATTDTQDLATPKNLITPDPTGTDPSRDRDNASARPMVFANGFALSPYAETGAPGGSIKSPPRTLWHASPGSTTTPK
jgi:error-prone DNA polymerase